MSSRIKILFLDFLYIYATFASLILGLFIGKYPNIMSKGLFWRDYPKILAILMFTIDSVLVAYIIYVGPHHLPKAFFMAGAVLFGLTITLVIDFVILGFLTAALDKTPTENNQVMD